MFVAAACASAPEEEAETTPESPPETAAPSIQEVRRQIELAIGDAQATSPNQCALIALGERPCGGPRFYRAYSTLQTESAQLRSLVDLYDRLDRERNLERGLISTCEVLPRPAVRLEGGQCVAIDGRSPASPKDVPRQTSEVGISGNIRSRIRRH